MSKYIIHACPERMWYVNQYLVPSMRNQGINGIVIKCDDKHVGCLESCMQIFMTTYGDGGSWHLQDDIIIGKDFKQRTEQFDNGIICGYCWDKDDNKNLIGNVKPHDMWWSFPCIYIPNNLVRECAKWFYTKAKYDQKYSDWVKSNKFDDALFKEFLEIYYPDENVINLKPNLVDHVDFLIGGSCINGIRPDKQTRALYFSDLDLVDELSEKLRGYDK